MRSACSRSRLEAVCLRNGHPGRADEIARVDEATESAAGALSVFCVVVLAVVLGAAVNACANRFPARVVEATFLGDQLRVRLAALGQDDFVLKLPNAAGQGVLEPGTEVEIGWRTEDCRALVA